MMMIVFVAVQEYILKVLFQPHPCICDLSYSSGGVDISILNYDYEARLVIYLPMRMCLTVRSGLLSLLTRSIINFQEALLTHTSSSIVGRFFETSTRHNMNDSTLFAVNK